MERINQMLEYVFDTWVDFIKYMLRGNVIDFFLGALSFIVPFVMFFAALFYVGMNVLAAFPWYVTLGGFVALMLLRFFWKVYKFNEEEE